MPRTRAASPTNDITFNADAFAQNLDASGKSPNTIAAYAKATRALTAFLEAQGMPLAVSNIRREHIEAFLISLRTAGNAPATVNQRFRSLVQFWKYLEAEGEVRTSPLRNISTPQIPDNPPPIVTPDDMARLLRTCNGSSFADRRDTAILFLFYDTGVRRAEMAGLLMTDIDLSARAMTVTGKGNRIRTVRFGRTAYQLLVRYLRARSQWVTERRRADRYADSPELWMGEQGPMGVHGVEQAVKRRARQADLPHVHCHTFRHSFADAYLRSGGQEGDLMSLAGWRSRQMVDRYGRSVAGERARANYDDHSPGDRLRRT